MLAYFWLKVFHISAMTIWFTGLFFLPRLFIAGARARPETDLEHLNSMGKTLYFRVLTPAGIATIALGLALIGFGFEGIWLPLKLVLVSALVMLHLYYGQLLLDLTHGQTRHGAAFYRVLNWLPLLLLLAIAALTAGKPEALPGLG